MLEGMFLGTLFLFVYILGFNQGVSISKGASKIEVKNPVIAVKQAIDETKKYVEGKKEEDRFEQSLQNMWNYDGTPQK